MSMKAWGWAVIAVFAITAAAPDRSEAGPLTKSTKASKKKRSSRGHNSSAAAMAVLDRATSYRSCAAVRDAGAAPIRRGDPGYSRRLDRDGDGIACE